MSSIYFGGTRSTLPYLDPLIEAVCQAVAGSGKKVHVGCQYGVDHQVILACPASSLMVFAVAVNPAKAPYFVRQAVTLGASVTFSAGGNQAPIPARYLLRSIAAFQGCSQAVFFNPGSGSLAVARECVRSGLPVFAFNQSMPAPVPSVAGHWAASQFFGFVCWQWSAHTQPALF